MESYIKDKKNLYSAIYEFINDSEDKYDDEHYNEYFQKLLLIIKNQQIEGDREEMLQFLKIIKSIGDHHHCDQHFYDKINQIILHYKKEINQLFSNDEIFHIFKSNKKIVLFLLKNNIIQVTEHLFEEITGKTGHIEHSYWFYFIPEIKKFFDDEKMEMINSTLLNLDSKFFDTYEKKRQEGESDIKICSLIRQDSIEEFIEYICKHNISPSDAISPTFFETNRFLIENEFHSIIEYAAFYGSTQIFLYMVSNKCELTPSLWLYAIHSNSVEMINLLESNNVPPPKNSDSDSDYIQCFIESIKCHHNNIADYIESNYLFQNENNTKEKEDIISCCIKYHNYSYFQMDLIIDHGFFYLGFYQYDKLFDLLFKMNEKNIEKRIIK